MTNTGKNFTSDDFDQDFGDDSDDFSDVGFEGDFETRSDLYDELKIDLAIINKLQPQLGWMKNLKSLAVISKDSSDCFCQRFYQGFYHHHWYTILKLFMFLKEIQKESRSLERLFINREDIHWYDGRVCLEWFMSGPSVKSFSLLESYFLEGEPLTELFNHKRFRELEQLGHITFSHRLEYLTKLKYVHGRCGDDIQVFLSFVF